MTLYWAWDRAMAARLNEEKLLDRQGELARTLNALDLAYPAGLILPVRPIGGDAV